MPDNLDVMPTAHLLELKRSVDGKLAKRDQGDAGSFGNDARRSEGPLHSALLLTLSAPPPALVARSVADAPTHNRPQNTAGHRWL